MDYLNSPEIDRIITEALREDVGDGDHTTLATIPADKRGVAVCLIKDNGVLAGVDFAERLFRKIDSTIEFIRQINDGSLVKPGDAAFEVRGSVRVLLTAERLALNVMQRMSGVATQTRLVADQLAGTNCKVLDTRKTTPLIRHLEKWAVIIGGGVNHRIGLYDMILIKDNHIDAAGGVKAAIDAVHDYLLANNLNLQIVVETRNLTEIDEAISVGGITRLLLDNMSPAQIKVAVERINGKYPTEASGNITLANARDYALAGVDFISMGALTHSVKALDMSLKIKK